MGNCYWNANNSSKPSPPPGWMQTKERRYGRSLVLQWELEEAG